MSNDFPFQALSFFRVAANANTPVFARTDYAVCTMEYVTRGGGTLEINGRTFALGADDIYFLHKHSDHRYMPDRNAPWHKLCWVADGPLMEELFECYGLSEVYVVRQATALRSYFETVLMLNPASEDVHRRAAVIFHEFVDACARHLRCRKDAAPETVLALKRHLDNLDEPDFSLSGYAARAGVSTAYLVRTFHRIYGCAPGEYRMRSRIEYARRLFRYTNSSVKEVAAQTGFADQYYFSRCFKRRVGVSPSAYRAAAAETA